jgi:hypothetical protein
MKLNATNALDLLRERPGRYIDHDAGQYRMREPDGTDVVLTEGGREYLVDLGYEIMDSLLAEHRLIHDGSRYRAKLIVHRFKAWSQSEGQSIISRRFATEAGIRLAKGEAIPGTAIEIDSGDLEPEGWTATDYQPGVEVQL